MAVENPWFMSEEYQKAQRALTQGFPTLRHLKLGDIPSGTIPMLNRTRLEPGGIYPSHLHEDMTELFLIIEGRATFTLRDSPHQASRRHLVPSQDILIVPERQIHGFANYESTDLVLWAFGVSRMQNGQTIFVPE